MPKLSVKDIDVNNRAVLVRVDFNVPTEEKDGRVSITDDTRIRETIPTIEYLRRRGAKVVLMAHFGRPKGQPVPKYSLQPVADRLAEMLGTEVQFSPDCIGEGVERRAGALAPGEVLLLENMRFHNEEEANDPFSRRRWRAWAMCTSTTRSARLIARMRPRRAWRVISPSRPRGCSWRRN